MKIQPKTDKYFNKIVEFRGVNGNIRKLLIVGPVRLKHNHLYKYYIYKCIHDPYFVHSYFNRANLISLCDKNIYDILFLNEDIYSCDGYIIAGLLESYIEVFKNENNRKK